MADTPKKRTATQVLYQSFVHEMAFRDYDLPQDKKPTSYPSSRPPVKQRVTPKAKKPEYTGVQSVGVVWE